MTMIECPCDGSALTARESAASLARREAPGTGGSTCDDRGGIGFRLLVVQPYRALSGYAINAQGRFGLAEAADPSVTLTRPADAGRPVIAPAGERQ
jgi:hypothetical protein